MRASSFVFPGLFLALTVGATAADWPRFRGPNGEGTVETGALPTDLGDPANVVWETSLPPGHSSPVVVGDRVYLTGAEGGGRVDAGRGKVIDEGGRLWTFAVDLSNGELLWKREAPRPRLERYQPTNSSASPSPVADESGVYVFFGDFGLLAYTPEGEERWRVPLGPFNNVNGHGSSPVVIDDLVVLVCDQDTDSYLLAVDKATGETRWKTPRPETTRTYVTPALFEPAGGPAQLIVPGAYQTASYAVETGEKLWWVNGGSWQPKATPMVAGEWIYINSWEGGGGNPEADVPTWEELLMEIDADKDALVVEPELTKFDSRMRFEFVDLDSNGFVERRDWDFQRAKMRSTSTLSALRPGDGRGDLTDSAVVWTLDRFLPNVPSPLLYEGVLYLVKDGGILTALHPETGHVLKQGRLAEALDKYYASPVAGAGKVYLFDQSGKATVIRAGVDWEILTTHDFEQPTFSTPALLDNGLILRAGSSVWRLREKDQ